VSRYPRRSIRPTTYRSLFLMLKKSPLAALCAVSVAAVLGLTACGGGVPGDSVVKVGEQTIKKSTFDHWLEIAAISAQGQQNPNATTAPAAKIPDEPDFKQCVADKTKSAPKPAQGQPEPTEAQFKTQCKQEYDQLKNQVLEFLIRSTWLDAEAGKLEIKLADKEVTKRIEDAKKQAFPKKEDFDKFLTRSGLTEADLFFQQRSELLEQKITQKVTKGTDKVSDAQVQSYYDKNKQRFAQPERRDVRIVLTKEKGTAEQAKKALQSGQSWKSVAKKYSIDQASKGNGGQLLGLSKGQQEKALDDALFGADKGDLVGPVKTQFGWYVAEIGKITAAKQQSLKESRESIVQILKGENQRKALDKFGKDYRERWKSETSCRDGFTIADCDNAPKADKGQTTTPPGAVPQGQQTQQQQQGTTTQPQGTATTQTEPGS